MSLDPGRHLLAIAHLSDSTVLGFDTAAERLVWEAHGAASVHGVRAAPELGRVFASATATNEMVALDDTSGAVVARTATGEFPDGLAYDPRTQTVFVSNKNGGTETVVDAQTLAPLGDVVVGDDVGNVQYDDADGTMVVAVGRSNELVTVDSSARRVLRRTPLPGCRGAHGVALDQTHGDAFVACEDNARVLQIALSTGAVLATQPTGRTPDVLAFDPGLGRLYVAAESGVVGVYAADTRGMHVLARAWLADGAHTVTVDPESHLVYLPLPDIDGRPMLRVMRPVG